MNKVRRMLREMVRIVGVVEKALVVLGRPVRRVLAASSAEY